MGKWKRRKIENEFTHLSCRCLWGMQHVRKYLQSFPHTHTDTSLLNWILWIDTSAAIKSQILISLSPQTRLQCCRTCDIFSGGLFTLPQSNHRTAPHTWHRGKL